MAGSRSFPREAVDTQRCWACGRNRPTTRWRWLKMSERYGTRATYTEVFDLCEPCARIKSRNGEWERYSDGR